MATTTACLPYAVNCSQAAGLLALLIIFAVVVNINYIRLLVNQTQVKLDKRIIVLNVRMAVIVPAYSVLMVIGYANPYLSPIVEAAASLFEGYCVYCFFKIVILSATGRPQIIKVLRASDYTKPCCYYFQKISTGCCFNFIWFCLFQFLAIRPIFVLASGIADMQGNKSVYTIFTGLSILSITAAMIALIRMYQTLGGLANHLFIERKILFIKAIIIALVIQNQFLNGQFVGPFDEEETMQRRRLLALIVGTEAFLTSFFLLAVFNKIEAPETAPQPSNERHLNSESEYSIQDTIPVTHRSDEVSESIAMSTCRLWSEMLCIWNYTFDGVSTQNENFYDDSTRNTNETFSKRIRNGNADNL